MADLLQGTLDMLVLKSLQLEPMHGWGITERIEQWSNDVLQINQGSLYPALHRLTRQGFITSSWRVTENNRRARYYALTAAGRRALADEYASWERLSRAVDVVMRISPSQITAPRRTSMFLTKLLARIRGAAGLVGGFAGERVREQDLDDELQFHLEKAVE